MLIAILVLLPLAVLTMVVVWRAMVHYHQEDYYENDEIYPAHPLPTLSRAIHP
jgi:uncharacterized membrane protein YjgN (DUF898 family)